MLAEMKICILSIAFLVTVCLCGNESKEIWLGTSPYCNVSPNDCVNRGMEYVRSDSSGDGKKCWSGTKVLCRDIPNQLPQVWFGTSPVCDGASRDCDIFDLKYLRSDKSGDGKRCLSGTKVMCQVKQPTTLTTNENRNHFNLVTYNIYGRPFTVTHDGQRERTCHIPRALFTKFPSTDAIVFQEAFMEGCIPEIPLRKLLEVYGFKYTTKTVGDDIKGQTGITFINGGVFIASKWPITYHRQEIFTDATANEADRLSKKGVMYAKIDKLKSIYHIFGTHLQAQEGKRNDEVRVLQATQMNKFMNKMLEGSPSSERVIIAGDLNADELENPLHTKQIEAALGVKFLSKSSESLPCTSCKKLNELIEAAYPKSEWLDYIGVSSKHAQPKSGEMTSVDLKSDTKFTFCNSAKLQPHYVFPFSNFCQVRMTTRELSDHFPVVANLRF